MHPDEQFDEEPSPPSDEDRPKCRSCGVPWVKHLGAIGVCQALQTAIRERDEARAEAERLRAELARKN